MPRLSHLWRSLVRLVRGPEPPEPSHYDARNDPVWRWLRLEQRKSERRTRNNTPIRPQGNPIVESAFPDRDREAPCDG